MPELCPRCRFALRAASQHGEVTGFGLASGDDVVWAPWRAGESVHEPLERWLAESPEHRAAFDLALCRSAAGCRD